VIEDRVTKAQNNTNIDKAFTDIRLRPGLATPRGALYFATLLRPTFGPLRPKLASSIKPEVHNVAQRRRGRTEPQPQGIRTQNFVPIGPAVPEICSRTDRRTDRWVDHNTPHPYRGGL